jgi:integrase
MSEAKPTGKKIGLREVRALAPETEIFDAGPGAVPAFGARRRSGASVSYFVMFRTSEGRLRRYTIGKHGAPWTPEMAREKALAILAEAKVEGRDPSADKIAKRRAATVSELCDFYIADADAGRLLTRRRTVKKASTILTDKSRIESHIRPLLGKMKVESVTREDVKKLLTDIASGKTAGRKPTGNKFGLSNRRGGEGAASRTVGLLGAIFTYAVDRRMRADNPVRGVVRFADGQRERRLSKEEYAALGATLRQKASEDMRGAIIGAARFLALTGWRRGEALGLCWGAVDLVSRTATLADTKTGKSVRPLSKAACDLLKKQTESFAPDALIFPPAKGKGVMTGFQRSFARIIKAAGIPEDVTAHVLRHSFASEASDLGYSEATIGSLIGHRGQTITSRYVHSADAVLLAAADAVAKRIGELMGDAKPEAKVVTMQGEAVA